jgi:hypothetical protein
MSIMAEGSDAVFDVGTTMWCELADICLALAPQTCAACRSWYTNDGFGLDAERSRELADVLDRKLGDGTIGQIIATRLAEAESVPDEICPYCEGTGVRTDQVGIECGYDERIVEDPGHPRHGQRGWCNGCSGLGTKRPFNAEYPIRDTAVIAAFVSFLRTCGGFQIY